MGSLPFQSELESCKMSKVSLLFLTICLAAVFTTGFALDCMVCDGTSGGILGVCGENEEGTSRTCPDNTIVCAKSECEKDGETMIMRLCAGDQKIEATPKTSECQDGIDLLGWDCTVCGCDTDNCNGATMTQMSTLVIVVVTLLSFLN